MSTPNSNPSSLGGGMPGAQPLGGLIGGGGGSHRSVQRCRSPAGA